MKVTYNSQKDTLHILLCSAPIEVSESVRTGLILDYDYQGKIIGLELSQASTHMSLENELGVFEYAATDAVSDGESANTQAEGTVLREAAVHGE